MSGPPPESRKCIREMIALYRATHYDVTLATGRIATLGIGAAVPSELLDWIGADAQAAFVTACNPHSRNLPHKENERRQDALRARLRATRCRCLEGIGRMPGADWREPSLLVAGIDLAGVDALARAFGQNAIVTVSAAGHAVLRIYRDDWRDALVGESDIVLA